jgi:hypothetical protein
MDGFPATALSSLENYHDLNCSERLVACKSSENFCSIRASCDSHWLVPAHAQSGGLTRSPPLRHSPGVIPVSFLKAFTKAATDAKPAAVAIAQLVVARTQSNRYFE